ncbi:glycosyltransferase [Patescibacteria group bacterium]|nr:glycosyltransferase [Patescibacteria group bacterium]
MKLIYIANARIPTEKAHGYQICKMCEEFSKQGVSVELWIPTRENRIRDDSFAFYGLKKNFTIKPIKTPDFIKYGNPLGQFGFWLQIIFFLLNLTFRKAEKDSIIYTRNPEIAWLFSLKGYETVLEAHKWPKSKVKLHRLLIKRIDKLIVLTCGLKDLFVKSDFLKENILIAPDGVDLQKFDLSLTKEQARQQLNLPQDKIILGYTGSFRTMGKDKGIMNILKSLQELSKEYQNIHFVAVGGSQQDIQYYSKLAQDLKVINYISLLQRVDLDKLAIFQKAFDVLLMPFPNKEHYAYYMSPLKMFEYMASKRPIITSDLPSIREVLNEDSAVIVAPDSPKELFKGIKMVIENPEMAEALANQAFIDVQNYSWGERTQKILNFIK